MENFQYNIKLKKNIDPDLIYSIILKLLNRMIANIMKNLYCEEA